MPMIHALLTKIGTAFIALGLTFGAIAPATPSFGSVTPVGGSQYTLSGAGITSTQATIPLTSFTTPDGRPLTMSMFGTIGYGALEPQTTAKLEDVTFSGIVQNANGTATLTGVTRGNDFVSSYAASTTLAHSHAGGATFILTNTAGFYTQFASVNNAQTISGVWTFGSTSPPRYDADPIWGNFGTNVLADIAYVNSVVAAGAANASETVKGIIQLATGAQATLGTSLGSTGARLVVPNSLATSTPYSATPAGSFPTSGSIGGKISQLWIDLTQVFTFTGGLVSTATTTLAGSNINSNALKINTVSYQWPSSQGAAGSLLLNNGSGVLSWSTAIPHYSGSGSVTANNNTATTSLMTIPSGTLSASSTMSFLAYVSSTQGNSSSGTFSIALNGTAILSATIPNTAAAGGNNCIVQGIIYNNTSVSAQQFTATVSCVNTNSSLTSNVNISGASVINTSGSVAVSGVIVSPASVNFSIGSLTVTANP